jgi:hypothetical protein
MTKLTINYIKSTFVPINLDPEDQRSISHILGCPISTFPQTYLGLPLPDSKLPYWVLYLLLHSLDGRIDTLSIKGATSGGRITLTKSILSALPSHTTACIKVPKWLHKEIDKRRRTYF